MLYKKIIYVGSQKRRFSKILFFYFDFTNNIEGQFHCCVKNVMHKNVVTFLVLSKHSHCFHGLNYTNKLQYLNTSDFMSHFGSGSCRHHGFKSFWSRKNW